PFLKRVGVMWQTGSVDVGAEHFMSNIFRKRLIVATDSLQPAGHSNSKRVLLFLPEGEWHELGLLFYAFIVRKAGHEILYLGQSTPYNALADVIERWHPHLLITGSLTRLPFERPESYLSRLSNAFSKTKILVSGAMAEMAAKKKFANIFPVTTVHELKEHL
ncbi:MAG TPA: hypothetical protein PKJ71_12105, partial [Bacteroidales bacterium]|nr:hypothetical protein [Bacteroidales bacterium]